MNIFNGRLELQSVITDEPTKWTISASFIDNTGFFYATDILLGDIVYNDGTSLGLGLLRYKVVYIDPLTDYSTLYAQIEWALPTTNDIYEPLCGYETIVGRQLLGGVFLPTPAVQNLSDNFIAYARNIESWLASRFSYSNRVYNAPYIGDKDGVNVFFTPIDRFITDTLSVKINGLEIQRNIDYTVEDSTIVLVLAPVDEETMVLDFNKE
jgi:hypothetical protein